MIDLENLCCHQVHPLKIIFDRYDRCQIASELNIPAAILGNILQGYELSSPEIEKRMLSLADQILEAEAAEQFL